MIIMSICLTNGATSSKVAPSRALSRTGRHTRRSQWRGFPFTVGAVAPASRPSPMIAIIGSALTPPSHVTMSY